MAAPSIDEFCAVLTGAQQGNSGALARLSAFQKNKLEFLKMTARILGDSNRPNEVRQVAGLQWKRLYESASEEAREKRAEQWLRLDAGLRTTLKKLAWNGLNCPDPSVNRASGQVIAQIALIELPKNQWPDLVKNLLGVIKNEAEPKLKVASLTCIGFICEEMHEMDHAYTMQILNALTFGMRKEVGNAEVILAASTAFSHVIKLLEPHMREQQQRDYIMKTICAAAQIPSAKIRAKAMQNLNQLSLTYYEYMSNYIRHIVTLFTACLEKDEASVALHAIEFWSGMCDLEFELYEQNQRDSTIKFHDFIGVLVGDIVKPLLKVVTRNHLLEEDESEVWDLPEAAAMCLNLIAGTIGSKIMRHVMPFVGQNIKSSEATHREAAIKVFGCLLDGPNTDDIETDLNNALPSLVNMLEKDPEPAVRDTASWALSRVCEFHARVIQQEQKLSKILSVFCKAAKSDRPGIAALASQGIGFIATACSSPTEPSSPLDKFFQPIVRDLLSATERDDADNANLRLLAFDSITILVQRSSEFNFPLINTLCNNFMGRLQKSFTISDPELRSELQGYLCSVLLVIVQRLDEAIKPHAKNMLSLFLTIFKNADPEHLVLEDALMAVGSVANALHQDFKPFVKLLMPFLIRGLEAHEAAAVCAASVGAIGDFFRAVGNEIKPLCDCDKIMRALMDAANDPKVDKGVKPHILSTFGDIALALGEHFNRYLKAVASLLLKAAKAKKRPDDYDYNAYVDTLRESVLDGFTGIFQSLKDSGKPDSCTPILEEVFTFIVQIGESKSNPSTTELALVGLIGDIASLGSPSILRYVTNPKITNLVKRLQRQWEENDEEEPELRETASWAMEQIQQCANGVRN